MGKTYYMCPFSKRICNYGLTIADWAEPNESIKCPLWNNGCGIAKIATSLTKLAKTYADD